MENKYLYDQVVNDNGNSTMYLGSRIYKLFQVESLKDTKGDLNPDNKLTDPNLVSPAVVNIEIYFKNPSLKKITEMRADGVASLVSDVGGQLGLWLGMSIVTSCETAYAIFRCFIPRRNPGKVDSNELESGMAKPAFVLE